MVPQFDTSWYVGEVFWLLLTFGLLFLGMKYFIFPMIQDVFVERKQLIENDLSIASVVNERAEVLMKDYNAHILSAQEAKAEVINETYQDIQKFSAHVDAEHDEVFRSQIDETEKQMQKVRADFVDEVDNLAVQIAEKLAIKLANTTIQKTEVK
mgnify:CR=1 FL=1